MQRSPDSYSLATAPQAIARRLIDELPEFEDLRDVRLVCVLSQPAVFFHGFGARAFIGPCTVQGAYRDLFLWFINQMAQPITDGEDPDFLAVFDAAIWQSLDSVQRERLVYHEVRHLRPIPNEESGELRRHQDGRLQIRVVPHDVEVFTSEVERYGAEVCELDELARAMVSSQRKTRRVA